MAVDICIRISEYVPGYQFIYEGIIYAEGYQYVWTNINICRRISIYVEGYQYM